MNKELKRLYIFTLKRNYGPYIDRVYKGIYHISFYTQPLGGWLCKLKPDSVPWSICSEKDYYIEGLKVEE